MESDKVWFELYVKHWSNTNENYINLTNLNVDIKICVGGIMHLLYSHVQRMQLA